MKECDDSGSKCASKGLTILGLDDLPIDLALFKKVKAEKLKNMEEACFKYKHDKGGGKLESQDCDVESMPVACYAKCGQSGRLVQLMSITIISTILLPTPNLDNVDICQDPHFFAYDDGKKCCDTNEESDGDPLTTGSSSCKGGTRNCKDMNAGENCQDAREPYESAALMLAQQAWKTFTKV